jgi:NAD(P)-dependent dehydrogenase (short-subunit alcohol dehydrogenase family)
LEFYMMSTFLPFKQRNSTSKAEVVVVTGASAGVGRATVRAFAARGARLGLLARGQDGLQAAQNDVRASGGEALVFPTDVADAAQVEAAAAAVEDAFGAIDVWVNNAMVSVFSPIKEMTPGEFRRVTEVTYLGYVHGTLSALRRMLPRDRGVIIQVGSALAYRGIPLQAAYCAAKHAIQGFTDSLRCELLHDRSHVRVTMIQMPALNTPQFNWVKSRLQHKAQPVPPIFQPEVAAQRIFTGMAEAAMHFRHYRLPEVFAGFERQDYQVPVRYPVACHPQAWAAGAVPSLLTTCLGLVPEAFAHGLRIVRPSLPGFLDRLEVCGLRVGDGVADLQFERTPDAARVHVLRTTGQLEVQIED